MTEVSSRPKAGWGACERRGPLTNDSDRRGFRDRVLCRPVWDTTMPSGIRVGSPLVHGPHCTLDFSPVFSPDSRQVRRSRNTAGCCVSALFCSLEASACRIELGTQATRGHDKPGASIHRQAREPKESEKRDYRTAKGTKGETAKRRRCHKPKTAGLAVSEWKFRRVEVSSSGAFTAFSLRCQPAS